MIIFGKGLQLLGKKKYSEKKRATTVKGQVLPLSTWLGAFILQFYLENGDMMRNGDMRRKTLYIMDFKSHTKVKP